MPSERDNRREILWNCSWSDERVYVDVPSVWERKEIGRSGVRFHGPNQELHFQYLGHDEFGHNHQDRFYACHRCGPSQEGTLTTDVGDCIYWATYTAKDNSCHKHYGCVGSREQAFVIACRLVDMTEVAIQEFDSIVSSIRWRS